MNASKLLHFNTLVFVDLESTGLPGKEDDGGPTRITEICLISVTREHFLKFKSEPRILRKLIIPVNPRKPISKVAAEITGLTNELLVNEEPLNEEKVNLMKSFIAELQTPVCFIAHNGYYFDFPLLKGELKPFPTIFPGSVGFADSLVCFRELSQHDVYESDDSISLNPDVSGIDLVFSDIVAEIEKGSGDVIHNSMTEIRNVNETTPHKDDDVLPRTGGRFYKQSYHLKAIYERLFGSAIPNAHTAEGDTIALLKCCAKYRETILRWFDSNYRSLDDIKSLY